MGKSDYDYAELDINSILKTIITPEWKYIYNYRDKTEQLYNIKSDPLEQNNLVDENLSQLNTLKEQLFDWVSTSKKYSPTSILLPMSQKDRERLEALGYLPTKGSGLRKTQ